MRSQIRSPFSLPIIHFTLRMFFSTKSFCLYLDCWNFNSPFVLVESQELTKAQDAYAGAQQKRAEAHGAGSENVTNEKGWICRSKVDLAALNIGGFRHPISNA